MKPVFTVTEGMLPVSTSYCPGCTHGVAHRIIMETLDEMGLLGKTLGGREIHNADDFAMAFLEKGLVAVVSCTAFGFPNYVRWTYACSMDNIKEGLDRLEKFLREG